MGIASVIDGHREHSSLLQEGWLNRERQETPKQKHSLPIASTARSYESHQVFSFPKDSDREPQQTDC